MKNNSVKNGLIFLIIILFIVSSVMPMVFGFDSKIAEKDVFLENLAFACSHDGGSSKLEYYKLQLLQDWDEIKDDDIVNNVVESENVEVVKRSVGPLLSGGLMNSSWPMKCHDLHHTSRSLYSTAHITGLEKWRFYSDGWVEGSAVIDDDGVIYYGDFDWRLHAVFPDGTEKWNYEVNGMIWSAPAIAEDGTLYVGTYGDVLYAINRDGTEKWRFPSGDSISSSPAIAEDGTIYFGVMGPGWNKGRIYAVNPDGTEKWHYDTSDLIESDPAVGDDGTIYIGSMDNFLYAFYPNGTLRWRFNTGDEIHNHPSIADDGTVYIGSFDDYLYAINPDGTEKWKYHTEWGASGGIAIGEDGTVYVGTENVYAIWPDNGTTRWVFNLGSNGWVGESSPAISADGTIYIGTHLDGGGGDIIAINPDGTEQWRKRIAYKWVDSSPCIGPDGTVYIGSAYEMGRGYLHAFGIGELEADANGPYYGLVDEPVQFQGSSKGGYRPYSWLWDFGDTYTSEEQNPLHAYTSSGNYTVTLTVTDNTSNTSSNSTWAWIQTSNDPPNKPSITGETNGDVGTSYDYTVTASDPDESIIWYYVDWGDQSNTGWLGPYNNGQTITKSHKWTSKGTYNISAKAKDPYDAEGPWGYLEVEMPVNLQGSQMQSSQQSTKLLLFQILEKIMNHFPFGC